MKISRILGFITDLLFPPRCVACGTVKELDRRSELCSECADCFSKERLTVCDICGKAPTECLCSDIGGELPLFMLFYTGNDTKVSEKLVFSLKDDKASHAANYFARELSAVILKRFIADGLSPNDWCVTYPPRSSANLEKYGFDHGRKLARAISDYTGIRFIECFERTESAEQKSLGVDERKKNAESSLAIKEGLDVSGMNIMIVDDIITTGATVSSCKALLIDNGASKVSYSSIFRTMPKVRRPKPKNENTDELWFAV